MIYAQAKIETLTKPRVFSRGEKMGCVLAAIFACAAVASPARAQDTRPALNFFGLPGYISVPMARPLPDADLALSFRHSDSRQLGGLAFQITPKLSGAFRYGHVERNDAAFYDRSFDLQYQILEPQNARPGLAIGLRDFIGTGLLSSEYVVATLQPVPNVTASIGLGWGALGAAADFPALISSDRPTWSGLGGEPGFDQWFRGPAALFAGVNWRMRPDLTLSAEYSGEDGDYGGPHGAGMTALGVNYQLANSAWVSGNVDSLGRLGIGLDFVVNPRTAKVASTTVPPTGVATPQPVSIPRLTERLAAQGISLQAIQIQDGTARLRLENQRYRSTAQAIGRTTRVLLAELTPSVAVYEIEMSSGALPAARVVLRRSDLVGVQGQPKVADVNWDPSKITAAEPWASDWLKTTPRVDLKIKPYLAFSLFDPDNPIRGDLGLEAASTIHIAPNLQIDGVLRARVAGNRAGSVRVSDSKLPPVRSDAVRYAQDGDMTVPRLALSYDAILGENLFTKVSVGYLEEMFAGAAVEMLWKPVDSRFAIGLEFGHVWQRDTGFGFGTQDYNYSISTGALSVYYAMTPEYDLRVDLGQYLAGDQGATLALERRFANGWRIGAYATLTDVSFSDFGEGSFDKAIYFTIPIDTVLGRASTTLADIKIQPILRDGGARLNLGRSLYETVRPSHASDLQRDWISFKN